MVLNLALGVTVPFMTTKITSNLATTFNKLNSLRECENGEETEIKH
jgi:hypothetical protein